MSGFLHFYGDVTIEAVFEKCVNALYRASFISTRWCVYRWEKIKSVNALYRASFISTISEDDGKCSRECVNALPRAYFISTWVAAVFEKQQPIVSMPYLGLLLFLLTSWAKEVWKAWCVNALYWAYFISTAFCAIASASTVMCQCPLSGFSYFYKVEHGTSVTVNPMCQCSMASFLYFYKSRLCEKDL